MDNLQHIDDLLKSSATSFANGLEVGEKDWLAIERKLRYRKNRIYAVWFFLALIFVSSTIVLFTNKNTLDRSVSNKTSSKSEPVLINEKDSQSPITQIERAIENKSLSTEADKLPESNSFIGNSSRNTIVNNIQPITENIDNPSETTSEIPVAIKAPKAIKIREFSSYNPISYNLTIPFMIPYNSLVSNDDRNNVPSQRDNLNGYWEAGLSFTPSISNKFISEKIGLSGLINRNYYANAASNENAAFSSSTGINAQYHLPSGMFVSTGLFIAQRSENLNYNYTITEYPVVNNNKIEQYNPLSSAAYVTVKHQGSNSYHFVEIPLNIGYKREISSKFELRGQFGMSYLGLFNLNGVKADYTSLELKNLSDYNFAQNNLAANAKLGVYLNKSRFTIGAEPIFNYNITSLSSENSPINVKPYSYGFNISTNYKFKN